MRLAFPSEPGESYSAAASTPEYRDLYTFRDVRALTRLGEAVDGIGDVNADGYVDWVIGAPQFDVGPGFISVQSGRNGRRLFSVQGDNSGDAFGVSVSGAGDVDMDGTPDIIVGALDGGPSQNGYVKVLSGRDGATLTTFSDPSPDVREFGWKVSGPGDLDGDGHGDIVVGTIAETVDGLEEAGRVRVFSGRTAGVLYTFTGTGPFRHLGQSVSGVGDVNLDGHPDFVMGSPIGDSPEAEFVGWVAVVSGVDGTILHNLYGPALGSGIESATRFGRSVAAAGDLNLDGYADVVVGAITDPTAGSNAGKVYVFSGLDGSELMSFVGDEPEEFFGESVSGSGDANGDGFPDIVGTGFSGGQVRSGLDGSLLFRTPELVPEGLDGGDNGDDVPEVKSFGSVRFFGDVNRDGRDDVLVGVPLDSANGQLSGRAVVLSGRALRRSRFVDRFANGAFSDGSDGEPVDYLASCAVDDSHEMQGRLTLSGPVPECEPTATVLSNAESAGQITATLTVGLDGELMDFGEGITLALIGTDGSDLGLLALLRTGVPGVFDDGIVLTLGDEEAVASEDRGEEPQLSEIAILTMDASTYRVPKSIEIRITLQEDDSALVAHGSYRELFRRRRPAFIDLDPAGGPATEFPLDIPNRFGFIAAHQDPSQPYSFDLEKLRVRYGTSGR